MKYRDLEAHLLGGLNNVGMVLEDRTGTPIRDKSGQLIKVGDHVYGFSGRIDRGYACYVTPQGSVSLIGITYYGTDRGAVDPRRSIVKEPSEETKDREVPPATRWNQTHPVDIPAAVDKALETVNAKQ